MRNLLLAAAILLGIVISASAARQIAIPRTPEQAIAGELQAFYGQVKEIDPAARTLTLGMPMRFVFKVPARSEITVRGGGPVTLRSIKPGGGARVEAVRGVKDWTARKITFEPGSVFPEEMSATTRDGKTITGLDVANYITYRPRPEEEKRNFPDGSGLFLLTLRPDGKVASVTPIKSMPNDQLDKAVTARLRRMKFRPGALTEVRMPVTFLLHHFW